MAPSELLTVLSLWAPVLFFVVFLFLGLTVHRRGEFNINFSLFGFGISRKFEDIRAIAAAFFLLAVLVASFPAFRDYTPFFPNNYKMTVSFDDEGIDGVLEEFTAGEIADLNLISDWRLRKQRYLVQVNELLTTKGGSTFVIDQNTVGVGGTTFFPRKAKGGLQTYEIDEAKGSMILRNPAGGSPSIESEFTHWPTDASRMKASLIDVYFRWTMIIRPEFQQRIRMGPEIDDIITLDQPVTVVTKVRFFPLVKADKSLYLTPVEENNDSQSTAGMIQYFPVAYAIYDPR